MTSRTIIYGKVFLKKNNNEGHQFRDSWDYSIIRLTKIEKTKFFIVFSNFDCDPEIIIE